MRCIVTAGPTYEPLDKVRRLTNFSTGRLGSELANFLARQGHAVTLLLGEQATWRAELQVQKVETFGTTDDLANRLQALTPSGVDAVFHAAAVSDFKFGKVWLASDRGPHHEVRSGKISTRDGTLLAELVPTPKILKQLRTWFPTACLVGWKYEVEGDRWAVLRVAQKQISDCRIDASVANGPAYGPGFGLVTPPDQHVELASTAALCEALHRFMCTRGKK